MRLLSRVLRILAKELTAATSVMYSSSNELSTPVFDNAKIGNKRKPIHMYVGVCACVYVL